MTEEWTSRWHITANGEVIRQWTHNGEAGHHVYRRFDSTRRPKLTELAALDERVASFGQTWGRLTAVLALLGGLGILGVIVGLFVLPSFGVPGGIALAVGVTSVVIIVLVPIAAIVIMRVSRERTARLHAEAGLADESGLTVPMAQAEALIAEPGTETSSPVAAKAP